GIVLAIIFLSLLFSVSALVFSEYKKPYLALTLSIVLSFVSAALYWLFEYCVFYKNRSSAFSVGYFGTIVLGAAFTFFVTSVFPIYFVFDYPPQLTAMYLKTACVRFCLFNAVTLVLRLGIETYRYIKDVFNYTHEQ
ncbi:MAG: hypothetical protein IJY94_04220, partial [Clostridia bacterium]|nr:hypothetical protein [Clostridia bacterium]